MNPRRSPQVATEPIGIFTISIVKTSNVTLTAVSEDSFDVQAMIQRFRDRAEAVKRRPLPPVAGEERRLFIAQAEQDYMDFAMIGDAEGSLDDGVLTLRVDLRPKSET